MTIDTAKPEVEIKVRLTDRAAFVQKLQALGFRLQTPEAMERNVLFDTPDGRLRRRGQLLRIRQYGGRWLLTHKAPGNGSSAGTHKERMETETEIGDGNALAAIFERLGYRQGFVYEKCRAEWTDGTGHIVVDATPIGDFAELEGESPWIDATAEKLDISPSEYLTASYGQLFLDWKAAQNHPAENMTFAEILDGNFGTHSIRLSS